MAAMTSQQNMADMSSRQNIGRHRCHVKTGRGSNLTFLFWLRPFLQLGRAFKSETKEK